MNMFDYPLQATPWLIEERAWVGLVSAASKSDPSALALRPGQVMMEKTDDGIALGSRVARRPDGVAVLQLIGPIVARGTRANRIVSVVFGGTVLEDWLSSLGRLADDPDVKAIVLDVDSPGGQVSGVAEAAMLVREVAIKKPTIAFSSGQMCSAAYWIGCAASKIFVDVQAMLGSIGCVMTVESDDELMARLGITRHTFIASAGPDKSPDPAQASGAARYQELTDTLGARFVEAVAKFRGISEAKVKKDFGRGWLKIGRDAVEAGMADAVGSMNDAAAAALAMAMAIADGRGTTKPIVARVAPGITARVAPVSVGAS